MLKRKMAGFDAVNKVFLTGTTFFTCLVDVHSDGFEQKGVWWCNANLMEAVIANTDVSNNANKSSSRQPDKTNKQIELM